MQPLVLNSASMNVRLAQRLLNRALRRTPGFVRLREDGAFGRRTAAAVAQLQALNRISTERDRIGPLTWRALGLTVDVERPVTMRAQHYDMGCWAAAAAMVLDRNMSVGTNGADLGVTRGLIPTLDNVERFTRQFGWSVQSPPADVRTLAIHLQSSPIWMAGTVILEDGSTGGHVVVISAAWGDGSEAGSMIRIHDPWPVDHGSVTHCLYPAIVLEGDLPFDPIYIAGPF